MEDFRRTLASAALPAILLIGASPGRAQETDPLQARSWAAACSACHGVRPSDPPGIARLAGVESADLLSKLQGFRSGSLESTLMRQIALGYSDEQLRAIARHLSKQE